MTPHHFPGEDIRKKISSKVEFAFGKIAPSGYQLSDTLRLYLEVDPMTWYYFEITDDRVATISADPEDFDKAVKTRKSKPKVERLQSMHKNLFLSRFIKRYLFGK